MFERQYSDEEILIRIIETSGSDNPDSWTYEIWNHGYRHTVGFGEELQRCYAEIERQRALIERAAEHIKEHELCYPTPNRMTQWLKDAGYLG